MIMTSNIKLRHEVLQSRTGTRKIQPSVKSLMKKSLISINSTYCQRSRWIFLSCIVAPEIKLQQFQMNYREQGIYNTQEMYRNHCRMRQKNTKSVKP